MKLFIFGATGDLVKRKILPALQLIRKEDLEIYAIGRKNLDDKSYSDIACEKCSLEFKKKVHYIKVNYEQSNIGGNLREQLEKQRLNYFYIALPPKIYKSILILLSEIKKDGFKIKILIEKPFGNNFQEAEELNKFIEKNNLKEDFFLSDHYLFKEGIIDLKKRDFKKAEIFSLEEIGLEGRITYYDDIGALKDMIQSHLINILFKITENIKLEDIEIKKYIRGQYGDGKTEGYVKELGKNSNTETFVYLKIKVGNKEITLVSGKGMDKKEIRIIIDDGDIQVRTNGDYEKIFINFFSNKKENFPKIENTILAWKIIEKISKTKSNLIYYNKGDNLDKILEKYNQA